MSYALIKGSGELTQGRAGGLDRRRTALIAALVVVGTLVPAGPAVGLEQKLVAGDGTTSDQFGFAVAIDGDTAVVGARADGGGRGAVYVYRRSGDTWSQIAKLTASSGTTLDQLGGSVAIDGDTIVAGAPGYSGAGKLEQGAVYTFTRDGPAVRQETARLTASDGAQQDLLGFSVAIDGDTIVAGAHKHNVGATLDQGAVYTFARSGAPARNETAKLTAFDGAAEDWLGYSVAIDGDTVVVGAPSDDAGAPASNEGSAYTFARTGAAERTETSKLLAPDAKPSDWNGFSVAIDGDTIVTGARFGDGVELDTGAAYTFTRLAPQVWSSSAKLTASDGADGDEFGRSVAIGGDTIVAGAPLDASGTGFGQGAVYEFASTGVPTRTETAKLRDPDAGSGDSLGESVALDADAILAGAWVDDVGSNVDQGSALVFFTPAPSLAVDDVSRIEGDSGQTAFSFTVSRLGQTAGASGVDWATADGSAGASSDYGAGSGRVEFAAGQTSKTIVVNVNGDGAAEPDEDFFVELSNPAAATLADDRGRGTIQNDDTAPPAGVAQPGSAPTSTSDGAQCRDRIAPVSVIARRSLRISGARLMLSGTSQDRGCGARGAGSVRAVYVAVYRATRGGCRFLMGNGRLSARRRCNRPILLRASGSSRFRFARTVRLPRGFYELWVLGQDAAGNRERGRAPGRRATFRLR